MDRKTQILNEREARYLKHQKASIEFDLCIIKANIIGLEKNIGLSYLIVNSVLSYIKNSLNITTLNSIDGYYAVAKFRKYSLSKEEMIKIENEHFLGRLVDIDVFIDGKLISRSHNLRKCLICNNDAFYCIKKQTHSFDDVFRKTVNIFYKPLNLEKIIIESMKIELDTYPKFGSVTTNYPSSHPDMDSNLMIKVSNHISNYFVRMFEVGLYTEIDGIMNKIELIGIDAIEEMLKITSGVNCYKGLIFNLGLIMASFGYVLTHACSEFILDEIFEVCFAISKNYLEIDFHGFGYQAYLNGFGGLRSEVKNRYQTIKNAILNFDYDYPKAFRYIASRSSDTTLLKRAKSFEAYNKFQGLLKSDMDSVEVNKIFLENNLTCGGSCDLFVCMIVLIKLDKVLNFIKREK